MEKRKIVEETVVEWNMSRGGKCEKKIGNV